MSDRILLCVDLSYQVYRAAAAHPRLTSRRTFTGGLYGFFTTFAKAARETKATDVAFCQDVKPYLRSTEYPEYKMLRKARADDELMKMYKASMELVVDVLDIAGHAPWGLVGFESDDLIGHAARRNRHRFSAIYAQSNDSDLFQLFDIPNFHVYRDSLATVMNGAELMKNTGLTPAQFMLASAIQGTHNDIAGLPGVGPVTAKKAVLNAATMREMREKGGAVIDRNMGLIRLPHRDFPPTLPLPQPLSAFSQRNFARALGMYDIDVTPTMERAFMQLRQGES